MMSDTFKINTILKQRSHDEKLWYRPFSQLSMLKSVIQSMWIENEWVEESWRSKMHFYVKYCAISTISLHQKLISRLFLKSIYIFKRRSDHWRLVIMLCFLTDAYVIKSLGGVWKHFFGGNGWITDWNQKQLWKSKCIHIKF